MLVNGEEVLLKEDMDIWIKYNGNKKLWAMLYLRMVKY